MAKKSVKKSKAPKRKDKPSKTKNNGKAKVKEVKVEKNKKETKSKSKSKQKDSIKQAIPSRKAKDKTKLKQVVQLTTVIEKGGAIVDKHAPQGHSVVKESGKTYSCTLNKSDLRHNNNKYYIIQLLKNDSTGQQTLFTRWGRVGAIRGMQTRGCPSVNSGIALYMSKYNAKTRGGYVELQIDFSEDKPPVVDSQKEEKKKKTTKQKKAKGKGSKSKLSTPVIDFIKMIYNKDILNTQMKEIGYDSSKLPLGKLGKTTIEDAYSVLNELEKVLKKKKNMSKLLDLSSQFYTLIPHNFGFKHMSNFVIDTIGKVEEKVKMLDSLDNMKIASKIISEEKDETDEANVIEAQYKKLHCFIRSINKSESIYDILNKYLTVNNSKYSHQKLELLEAFEIEREGEEAKFNSKLNNHKLLWHGTRITNLVGILSQGLRIAPPEAPSSGYSFGKGLYFADIASKSSMYCYPVNKIGLILLGEVALGNCEVRNNTDFNLPTTMKNTSNSVHGLGINVPSKEIVHEKMKIPLGESTTDRSNARYLSYNEFIVYNTNQVKLRYVLKMKYI